MNMNPNACRRLTSMGAILSLMVLAACSPVATAQPDAEQPSAAPPERIETNAIQTLTLIGPRGEEVVLTRQDLAALPREQVTFSRHEDTSVYEGPLLLDVLARVGVPASPLRKDQQATALLITAADGYQVVLGLAETDPATRADRIIIADTDDGEPLSPQAGPFMVVAEGDVRAARSARMAVSIRVIPLGEPQA